MFFNDFFWQPKRGSQFDRTHTNRDRVEGHAKIMRGYFNLDATYSEKYYRQRFSDAHKSFLAIEKLRRSMMIGSNLGGVQPER